jgi:hypothetical protein
MITATYLGTKGITSFKDPGGGYVTIVSVKVPRIVPLILCSFIACCGQGSMKIVLWRHGFGWSGELHVWRMTIQSKYTRRRYPPKHALRSMHIRLGRLPLPVLKADPLVDLGFRISLIGRHFGVFADSLEVPPIANVVSVIKLGSRISLICPQFGPFSHSL